MIIIITSSNDWVSHSMLSAEDISEGAYKYPVLLMLLDPLEMISLKS